ncbi:hypothetical protein B0J11DRAFT_160702 [Dendryphion nanum]|uniref:Cep57 centrosome microtubule-binding domain-containing protein n=1 Tax=Dendryphion nanum TaxID=256645 RepID=A0A9P9IU36_9PLEO|nr:hypothetical protein B0J11DRAFT_160702 [Dendryphion nanum]
MLQSSPPVSEAKARALRELSRSLSHSPRPDPSLSSHASDSNPTQQFNTTSSDFFNNPDVLMSTQQRLDEDETNDLPRYPNIRSTAKKINTWQGLRSEQPIPDTSMVNKQFNDFDHSFSDEEDLSIEQARGVRSNHSTPAKANNSLGGFNSLYDMTPPSTRTRKSYAAETGSLRKDAQIRRASRNDLDVTSQRAGSARNSPAAIGMDRKRPSLARLHAKVSEDESSFMDERPPTVTLQAKSTRWGGPRSRQTSLQMDGVADPGTQNNTNQKSRPTTAQNATAQSFMLPDIPNLTELVSGVFEDGTPMFSKTTPARSRFAPPRKNGRAGGQSNYYPIDSLPIPDEEKAIFTSLQLLQERVATLENERAEAERKIEEQEIEIIELRAASQARNGRDSALGSTDGEGAGKTTWRVEKTRLETLVQSLRTNLARVERKVELADIEKNRRNAERDNMMTRLGVASQNFEELKQENQALSTENNALREEIDSLRAENDDIRRQLSLQQDQFREETIQLRQKARQTDHNTQRENETLHIELNRVRVQNDEHTLKLQRKENELRRAQKELAEHARLRKENIDLQAQMEVLQAKRDQERRRWADKENELKAKINNRDETIQHFNDMTQENANEVIRAENENLRHNLEQLRAQHYEDARQWSDKEDRLRRKITVSKPREQFVSRESNTMPIDGTTSSHIQPQRRSSTRRENTQTRIANRVEQEVRNSRIVNTSYLSSQVESPRKTYTRISSIQRTSVPADPSRSVSAPVTSKKIAELDHSDAESTTDLSLAPRGTPYTARKWATAPATFEPPADLDLTQLTDFRPEDLAQLRRDIEEERRNNSRRAQSVPLERQPREDTVRSVASVKSTRQQSLPRKSSMKDITERTAGTVFEDMTARFSIHEAEAAVESTETQQANIDASMVSNTSRRRRSAPIENMTSAFIVPDIKIRAREQTGTLKIDIERELENREHDNDNCTVCRKQSSNSTPAPLRVPKLIPVSARMPDDVDATLRPSRSPKEALAIVVKELNDERIHLHMELAKWRAVLENHDASQGMRKRVQINDRIQELLRLIDIRDTHIYHLYDVAEAQSGDDATEQLVDDATRDINVQPEQGHAVPEKKNKDKKVTIQSYIDSDEEDDSRINVAGDEELPWEGFEDTGDHNFSNFNTGVGKRSSGLY